MEKVLHLNLKKKWYDMILSGGKKEEYREVKDYWIKRFSICEGNNKPDITRFYCKKALCTSCVIRGNGFHSKKFDAVIFSNGYSKNRPQFKKHLKNIKIGKGKEEWGAKKGEDYFVLELGELVWSKK